VGGEILLGILQHTWRRTSADGVVAGLHWSYLPDVFALLPGLLIVTLYGANQICFRAVLEQTIRLVGAWTIVAPWALGFAANEGALWAHVTSGSLAMMSAATWLKSERQP